MTPKAELFEKGKQRKITFPEDKRPGNRLVGVTKVSFLGEERSISRREEGTQNYRFKGGGELKLYLSAMLKRLQ